VNKNWLSGLLAFVFVTGLVVLPHSSGAQGLGSILSAPDTSAAETDIENIMRTAAENGVSVVVIDSDGRVLTQVGDSAPGLTPEQGGSSTLMAIQDDASAFRTALLDRFLNLPTAFNEVVYILRATSPDGTIFAYVEVLLYSLGLLGVGMWFQHEIYGKRIAKRFVVARIQENPEGYAGKMPFLMFRFFMGLSAF
jgi:hypothetical protein